MDLLERFPYSGRYSLKSTNQIAAFPFPLLWVTAAWRLSWIVEVSAQGRSRSSHVTGGKSSLVSFFCLLPGRDLPKGDNAPYFLP